LSQLGKRRWLSSQKQRQAIHLFSSLPEQFDNVKFQHSRFFIAFNQEINRP